MGPNWSFHERDAFYLLFLLLTVPLLSHPARRKPQTEVFITGDQFYINGRPTFAGRTQDGYKLEGLLSNSGMVQGIFDDLTLATQST